MNAIDKTVSTDISLGHLLDVLAVAPDAPLVFSYDGSPLAVNLTPEFLPTILQRCPALMAANRLTRKTPASGERSFETSQVLAPFSRRLSLRH